MSRSEIANREDLGRSNLGRSEVENRILVGTYDVPVVNSITAVEVETGDPDFEVDVTWSVSDPGGNLDRVEFILYNVTEDREENTAQFDISGGQASGDNYRLVAFNKDGSGDTFEVRMDVYDTNNLSVRGVEEVVENETVPPQIDQLTATEVETSNPDAEFDLTWEVSDPDGNLATLEITLRDVTDGGLGLESDVTPTVSGSSASGTSRLVASGDDGSGHEFEFTMTVTDGDGQIDQQTTTVFESEQKTSTGTYLDADISYGDAQNMWASIGPDPDALVLQDHERHYGMYEWLKTLEVSDVATNGLGGVSYSPGSGATDDQIYKLWLAFRNMGGEAPMGRLFRYPDEDFVLDNGAGRGFEGDPSVGVRINMSDTQVRKAITAQSALWVDLDIPGLDNPYYDNPQAKRKVMAQVCVDLMELERFIEEEGFQYGSANLIGMVVRDNLQAAAYAGDIVPDQVKFAVVEQAFHIFDEVQNSVFYPWINENMASKAMCGMLVCWRLLDDLGMSASQKNTIMSTVKDALYDDGAQGSATPNDDSYGRHADVDDDSTPIKIEGLTRPSGGWIENGGDHTTYNGIPMHYCLEGYSFVSEWSEWDFFHEMTKRIFVRAQHEAIRDYGGMTSAPSMYSNREMSPITREQSPNAGKYALAVMYFGEDVYPWIGDMTTNLVNNDQGGSSAVPPSVSDMENALQSNIDSVPFSEMQSWIRDWSLESRWGPRHGGIAYHAYEDGLYNEINQAAQNDDPLRTIPQMRDGNTYKRMKKDHMLVKQSDGGTEWGAHVHMSKNPGQWPFGMQALNSFWVEGAGPLIQTVTPKYTYDVPYRPNINFEVAFSDGSSAGLHSYRTSDTTPIMSRTGDGSTFIEQEFQKEGVINRTRADLTSNGLKMTCEVRPPSGSFNWINSYYLLPIFRGRGAYVWDLNDNADTAFPEFGGPRTLIEYYDGSSWQTLTTSNVTAQHVRLSRDIGNGRTYGYLTLNQQRTISMEHSEDYHQRNPWQANSFRHRDLRIVLHPNPGVGQTLSSPASIVYTLTPVDPT